MPFSLKVKPSSLPPQDLDTERFHSLLWSHFVTASEFSCLAKVAKAYHVFGRTYVPHIPNQLHGMQNKCTSSAYHYLLDQIAVSFHTKIICFVYKPLMLCT